VNAIGAGGSRETLLYSDKIHVEIERINSLGRYFRLGIKRAKRSAFIGRRMIVSLKWPIEQSRKALLLLRWPKHP